MTRPSDLSDALRNACQTSGLSALEIANDLDINRSTLQRFIRGDGDLTLIAPSRDCCASSSELRPRRESAVRPSMPTPAHRPLTPLSLLALLLIIAPTTSAQVLPEFDPAPPDPDRQISHFIRRILHDSDGNVWFGTNGDGVVRYRHNPDAPASSLNAFPPGSLEYLSINEGFGGVAVRAIAEDAHANIWFATNAGLTRFDGAAFTNFTRDDGLADDDTWCLEIDSRGAIWVGTLQGVSRFDGQSFTPFDLPESQPDHTRGVTSARIVHAIMEDSKGRMWFATNGGAHAFDGHTLTTISKADGLCGNVVNDILEDSQGNIWFATHHNGVCRWDGTTFTHITKDHDVEGTEAWSLTEDADGNIWFPIEGSGVYRFDGESLTNFSRRRGLASTAIQCIHEDRQGHIWLGGWLGLYRLEGSTFINVTHDRPGR